MSPEMIALLLNLAGMAELRLAVHRLGRRVDDHEGRLASLAPAAALLLGSAALFLGGCMDSARAAAGDAGQAAADGIAGGLTPEQAVAAGAGAFVAGLLTRELPKLLTRIRSR